MAVSLAEWIQARLEPVTGRPNVIVRDPMGLASDAEAELHAFAIERGFTVIRAATNLAFRVMYEEFVDGGAAKLLLLDQSPTRPPGRADVPHPPPLFYPEILAVTPANARLDLDLRRFLCAATGDLRWPNATNEYQYARLIRRYLPGVLRAHQNLRGAFPGRFTDCDLETIIAFAALGVPERAFRPLDASDYWKIGLLGHGALAEIEALAPEAVRPIQQALAAAPPPFRWLDGPDVDSVIRGFYLAAILHQHVAQWDLLLANVDPALTRCAQIDPAVLRDAAPRLVELDAEQARRDLEALEASLDRAALQLILLDRMELARAPGFAAALENERYSSLVRNLALLLALDDLLSARPALAEQSRVAAVVRPERGAEGARFVDVRPSIPWSNLKDAYLLADDLRTLRAELADTLRDARVAAAGALDFGFFRERWNGRRLNRLEYLVSALQRLVDSAELLPRSSEDLPPAFGSALTRMRRRVDEMAIEIADGLDALNRRFQDLVAARYPDWVKGDNTDNAADGAGPTVPILTAQFLARVLKPHWDPQREKAALLIFDGMRYDIWDELLKPVLLDRLELLADLPGLSILPSETQLTRKAISAGTFPDEFDSGAGEDRLLKSGLERALSLTSDVRVVPPVGAGTGETVRYRAGNLDVVIFELCDRALHNIRIRQDDGGRGVPDRPLSFIYQQQIKNMIDTEVMAIVRDLTPGTKVFITADHGFGRVGREPIWFESADLNEDQDCSYLNCWLKVPLDQASLPPAKRDKVIAFAPSQLRVPKNETRTFARGGPPLRKEYRAVVFPRVGYAFSRNGSPFRPDAFSHGGISLGELLVPMVVLRVKTRDEGVLALGPIDGPSEVPEGVSTEFRMQLSRSVSSGASDIRVDVDAFYALDAERPPLPRQTRYVPPSGADVTVRFLPDPADATADERRAGRMDRVLTITVTISEGRRTIRKTQTHRFAVTLTRGEFVRRMGTGNLGGILGLAPRNAREVAD